MKMCHWEFLCRSLKCSSADSFSVSLTILCSTFCDIRRLGYVSCFLLILRSLKQTNIKDLKEFIYYYLLPQFHLHAELRSTLFLLFSSSRTNFCFSLFARILTNNYFLPFLIWPFERTKVKFLWNQFKQNRQSEATSSKCLSTHTHTHLVRCKKESLILVPCSLTF